MSTQTDTARPRFYSEPVQNKAASEKEGRPIYDDREFVEVRFPGDRLSVFVDYVKDEHRERWPEAYAAFKRGELKAASGTPLEHWPQLSRSRVAELKAAGVLSVEELAGVTDNLLPKLGMNSRVEREQARAFLETAKGGSGVSQLVAENASMREQLETMQRQIALLMRGPEPVAPEPQERAVEELSDDELKAYIKNNTGVGVRGNVSRETLVQRATEIAIDAATREAA